MNVNEIIDALTKFRDQSPENGLTAVFSECPETGMSWRTDRIFEVVHKGETAIIIGIDGPFDGPETPDEDSLKYVEFLANLSEQEREEFLMN